MKYLGFVIAILQINFKQAIVFYKKKPYFCAAIKV